MVRAAWMISLCLAAAACSKESTSPPDAAPPPDAVPSATLTITVSGFGTVQSQDGAIHCGMACTHAYPLNTVVTLGQTPNPTFEFKGWSGACTGTGPCSVTVTANTTITATFDCPQNGTVFCD
jgi:hypothetical protein